MSTALVAFSVVTGLATLWALSLQVSDWRVARRVKKATQYPILIRRSVSHRSYAAAMTNLRTHITRDLHYRCDVVIGVNYGGMQFAADFASEIRKPLERVEVSVQLVEGVPQCVGVTPHFNLDDLTDKQVVVIDNSIRTGKTLLAVTQLVKQKAETVLSIVVYRPSDDAGNFCTPDHVLFASNKPLESLWK